MPATTISSYRLFHGRHYYRRPIPSWRRELDGKEPVTTMYFGEIPEIVHAIELARQETWQRYMGQGWEASNSSLPRAWTTDEVFTTVIASINVELREGESGHPLEPDFFWYSFVHLHEMREGLDRRLKNALDLATAEAFSYLGPDYMHGQLAHQKRFAIAGEQRPMSTFVDEQAFGVRPITHRRGEELPRENPFNAPTGSSRADGAVGRWISLTYEEDDPQKGFLWAYAGLEVCIRKAASRSRERVEEALYRQVDGVAVNRSSAVRELFWPSAFDGSGDVAREPQRNAVHAFAALAIVTQPNRADADVATFKRISKYRNGIHGVGFDEAEVERHRADAIDLLRRYAFAYLTS